MNPMLGPTRLSPRRTTTSKNTREIKFSRVTKLSLQAKKFLSHPSVIHQLEAIWTGKIVFHSALDHLHRMKDTRRYSVNTMTDLMLFRRAATLYDARDASLFKLSRLRVPRYKHITSTVSLAILLLLCVGIPYLLQGF